MDYFPIVIEYQDTGEKVIIKHPDEIKSGRAFKVLETSEPKISTV